MPSLIAVTDGLFFSYMPLWDIALRVFMACLIGFLLGLEREIYHHPAGMKTHMLVCLGSALTSMVAFEMAFHAGAMPVEARVDLSRIASGVVSGMGFIGAGAIIKSRDGTMVTGITTAANLWVSACLGIAVGMGYYYMSAAVLLAVLFVTVFLKSIEKKMFAKKRERSIDIMLLNKEVTLPALDAYFSSKKITVVSFEYRRYPEGRALSGETIYQCRYTIKLPHGMVFVALIGDLALIENIVEAYESLRGEGEDFRKAEKEESEENKKK